MIYYNEFDLDKVAMIKQLISDGWLPPGDIDSRSIKDVKAHEIKHYKQCHFFAGVGLWAIALELANWGDQPVWTGSCPCQPFSPAGKQKAQADERHLWPEWFRLIRECKPPTIFGEQVERAVAKAWVDGIYDDLESEEYAIGSAVLPACSVGKAHQRYRYWFVGHSNHEASRWHTGSFPGKEAQGSSPRCEDGDILNRFEIASSVGNTELHGSYEGAELGSSAPSAYQRRMQQFKRSNPSGGTTFITCPDGKRREVEPSISLLANGHPTDVSIIHAVGDAIVAELAAEFIQASR